MDCVVNSGISRVVQGATCPSRGEVVDGGSDASMAAMEEEEEEEEEEGQDSQLANLASRAYSCNQL